MSGWKTKRVELPDGTTKTVPWYDSGADEDGVRESSNVYDEETEEAETDGWKR